MAAGTSWPSSPPNLQFWTQRAHYTRHRRQMLGAMAFGQQPSHEWKLLLTAFQRLRYIALMPTLQLAFFCT